MGFNEGDAAGVHCGADTRAVVSSRCTMIQDMAVHKHASVVTTMVPIVTSTKLNGSTRGSQASNKSCEDSGDGHEN